LSARDSDKDTLNESAHKASDKFDKRSGTSANKEYQLCSMYTLFKK